MSLISNAFDHRSGSFKYPLAEVAAPAREASPAAIEGTLRAVTKNATKPFMYFNRVFSATNFIAKAASFQGFLIAFQPMLTVLSLPMQIFSSLAYAFMFFRNIYFLYLQNDFMSKMRGDYFKPLHNTSSQSLEEQVATLYAHLESSINKEEVSTLTMRSWETIQACHNSSIPAEEIAARITTIRKNITLDAFNTLKTYPSLENRVTKWCFEHFNKNMNRITTDLQSGSPEKQAAAFEEAQALLLDMDEEARKVLVINAIGTLAIVLAMINLVLVPLCPVVAIPLFIYAVGLSLTTLEYVANKSLQNHKGWEIDWRDSIPEWLRKRLFAPKLA